MAKKLGPQDPFQLVIDRSALNRLLSSESGDIALFIAKRAQRTAASARRRARPHRKTGELISGIGWEIGSDEEGVYADVVSRFDKFQERGHRAVDGTRVSPRRYLRPALYAGRRRRR
jgi:hypothetical protein